MRRHRAATVEQHEGLQRCWARPAAVVQRLTSLPQVACGRYACHQIIYSWLVLALAARLLPCTRLLILGTRPRSPLVVLAAVRTWPESLVIPQTSKIRVLLSQGDT